MCNGTSNQLGGVYLAGASTKVSAFTIGAQWPLYQDVCLVVTNCSLSCSWQGSVVDICGARGSKARAVQTTLVAGTPEALFAAAKAVSRTPSNAQAFQMTLSGNSTLILIGDTTLQLSAGPQFAPGTAVRFGAWSSPNVRVSSDGGLLLLTVRAKRFFVGRLICVCWGRG